MAHKLYSFFINVDIRLLTEDDKAELLRNLNITKGQIARIKMNMRGAILFDIVDKDDIICVLTFGERLRDKKREFIKYNGSLAYHLREKHGIEVEEEILVLYDYLKNLK